MLVKLLPSAGIGFHGMAYNETKVMEEKGEVLSMNNFPAFITEAEGNFARQKSAYDYLVLTSEQNERIKKPQFHAVISSKYQEDSKERLNQVASEFMKGMGYGNQPYIVYFHNDTDHNHIHIISTRVDIESGKKIKDSFENLKAQEVMEEILGEEYISKREQELSKLLDYNYSSIHQLNTLLERNGYKLKEVEGKKDEFSIIQGGRVKTNLKLSDIKFTEPNDQRRKQIWAILNKYKDIYSNQVFKVVDDRVNKGREGETHQERDKVKIEFSSELQIQLKKKFGIDIVFHHKDGQKPFGYTLIDHQGGNVYKGSTVFKMDKLFDITEQTIDKEILEERLSELWGEKLHNANNTITQEEEPIYSIQDLDIKVSSAYQRDVLDELLRVSFGGSDPLKIKPKRKRR